MPMDPLSELERLRLEALRAYAILDTPREPEFDDATRAAANACDVPMAKISFVDEGRQWLKSKIGLSFKETPRVVAFCNHTIREERILIVGDATTDPRFANNPMVTGEPHIRFYAGVPLRNAAGHTLGALCVLDVVPRQLDPKLIIALQALARQVMAQLELRRSLLELRRTVAERETLRQSVEQSERFALSTLNALTSHISILDDTGRVIAVNDAWERYAFANNGQATTTGVGANYLSVCDRAATKNCVSARRIATAIREIIAGRRRAFSIKYPCHSPTEHRWFIARITRFSGDGPLRVVVAHENVTQRKKAEIRLHHQSTHDALTDLPNRAFFLKRLKRCLLAQQADPSRQFAVLFLDLDRFKIINDSLGHAVGDKLLLTVAEVLKAGVRGGNGPAGTTTVARLGGDEFTILLDRLRDPGDAEKVAARLLAELGVPRIIDGQEVYTTVSIGIAHGDPRYVDAWEMVRDADAAMYHSKRNGKARYTVFDASMHDQALGALRLENDLRHAIERQEFFLEYQPIVNLRTGEPSGFEALIRWKNEQRGLVSPAAFIPHAEENGLIIPIGRWVLATACRQLAQWNADMPEAGKLTMNVNLSRKQLADDSILGDISEVLAATGVDPAHLNMEITESAVMENPKAPALLKQIKALGVQLSLDDFGTGQSSLSCLHRFPLSGLKIDRSFINNTHGRDQGALIEAVITLARNLGIEVVAEGLETPEQVALLQGLECDLGQGYFFARPLSAAAAREYILHPPACCAVEQRY